MAFDPTKPVENTQLDAPMMRDQLNSLKALIDQKPSQDDVINMIADRAAASPGSVDDLQLTVSNPPTQAEVQAIVDKLHELMFALKDE